MYRRYTRSEAGDLRSDEVYIYREQWEDGSRPPVQTQCLPTTFAQVIRSHSLTLWQFKYFVELNHSLGSIYSKYLRHSR